MDIQVDSREKARAIQKILAEFDRHGIRYYISKLWAGDYMSLDNPRLIIDRKQSLTELCGNLCQQHKRFRDELTRAQKMNIQLILLCEHGGKIKSLEDVRDWTNPRTYGYERKIRLAYQIPVTADIKAEIADLKAHGARIPQPPTSGEQLYKILATIKEKYGIRIEFCTKSETGRRIIELLGGNIDA